MDFTVGVDESCCDDDSVELRAPPILFFTMLLCLYLSATESESQKSVTIAHVDLDDALREEKSQKKKGIVA